MDTTTETPATEGKKPRKPMSQEQKDAISKKLKSHWRKHHAEGTPVAAAKKGKSKAKPKPAEPSKPAEQVLIHRGLWNLIRLHGFPNVHAELQHIKVRLEQLAAEGR